MNTPSRRNVLRSLAAVGAAAAAGVAVFLPRAANAYYSGPITDHFDGVEFFNPGGRKPHGLARVAQLYLTETWSPWPVSLPPAASPPPPPRVDRGARVTFIGHASWLIQVAGLNILVDPVFADRVSPLSFAGPRRVQPPAMAIEQLPPIDVVLVTHNHYDHLDVAAISRLWQRDKPRIVTPLGNDAIMRAAVSDLRATTLDWRQSVALAPSLRVHAEPTLHWSARGVRDRRHALWASFVIESPAGSIYAVGDSGFGDGATFREVGTRHPRLALALLPIGAYEPRWFMKDQHMNPSESVEAFVHCGASAALGHHWGTFQLTTEPREEPPAALAMALQAKGIAPDQFPAVRPGDVHQLAL